MLKKDLWFDTDIGSDVDDALALYILGILMKQKVVNLLGVSTVYGPVEKRSFAAHELLKRLSITNIPVYTGSSLPYSNKEKVWSTGKESDGCNLSIKNRQLVDYEDNQINDTFTLLMTGPLTNGIELLNLHDFKKYCREIVILGGSLGLHSQAPIIENNFEGDPWAAEQMFNSNLPITLIPVDLTLNYPLSKLVIQSIHTSSDQARKLISKWINNWVSFSKNFPNESPFREIVYLHDPIAAAYIAYPELFVKQKISVNIDKKGKLSWSKEYNNTQNISICTYIDEYLIKILENLLKLEQK